MAPHKTRKQPITGTPRPQAAISRKLAQSTISKYHTLLKQQRAVEKEIASLRRAESTLGASGQSGQSVPSRKRRFEQVDETPDAEARPPQDSRLTKLEASLAHINTQLADLGGIDGYQHASVLGQSTQRGGDSSKMLVPWLVELRGKGEMRGGVDGKLRMLEIGALTPTNYATTPWITNTPIDLNSRHAAIEQQDFLLRPLPASIDESYDIISCSLVLNFVADARDRGRMLSLMRQQLRPAPTSFAFIVLPTPCVRNSRYTTQESFVALVESVGFELVRDNVREEGKVAYWLFQWRKLDKGPGGRGKGKWGKKVVINEGKKRNNFAILLE